MLSASLPVASRGQYIFSSASFVDGSTSGRDTKTVKLIYECLIACYLTVPCINMQVRPICIQVLEDRLKGAHAL
jgi:hypothetical protein